MTDNLELLIDPDPEVDTLSTASFPYGYSGKRKTHAEYLVWTSWLRLEPEFARRFMALMQLGFQTGHDLGAGGTWRSSEGQEKLFRSRYHVDPKGKLYWKAENGDGPWWTKNPGVAAAAIPGKSFHETSAPDGKCYAIDAIGDIVWMNAHLEAFGLYNFDSEPWHVQPKGIPSGRKPGMIYPNLVPMVLPQSQKPVVVPNPPLVEGDRGNQVTLLQNAITFWKWYTLKGDGWFGPETTKGVKAMQTALGGLDVDGKYGPKTAAKYEQFVLQMKKFDPTK